MNRYALFIFMSIYCSMPAHLNAFQAQVATVQRAATPLELHMLDNVKWGKLTKKMLQAFIKQGADVNAETTDGQTALMLAARYGYTDIVQQLIAAGADVNTKGPDGTTALMWITCCGYRAIVQQLVAAGANPDLQNEQDENKTALDYASRSIKAEMAKAIEDGKKERKERATYLERHAKNLQSVAQKALEPGLRGSESLAEDLSEAVAQEIIKPRKWHKKSSELAAEKKETS